MPTTRRRNKNNGGRKRNGGPTKTVKRKNKSPPHRVNDDSNKSTRTTRSSSATHQKVEENDDSPQARRARVQALLFRAIDGKVDWTAAEKKKKKELVRKKTTKILSPKGKSEDKSLSDEEKASAPKDWDTTHIYSPDELKSCDPQECDGCDDNLAVAKWEKMGFLPWNGCLECQTE